MPSAASVCYQCLPRPPSVFPQCPSWTLWPTRPFMADVNKAAFPTFIPEQSRSFIHTEHRKLTVRSTLGHRLVPLRSLLCGHSTKKWGGRDGRFQFSNTSGLLHNHLASSSPALMAPFSRLTGPMRGLGQPRGDPHPHIHSL